MVAAMPPPVPTSLRVTGEGDGQVSLAWNGVPGAAGYNLYRSPLSGGGFVKVNNAPLSATAYTDTGLRNARNYSYVVTSLDEKGNESAFSNEVQAMPRLQIGWANLQWPPSITHTISAINRTPLIFGQVWIDGVTNRPGATEGLRAQLGYGPRDSDPAGNPAWIWIEAEFNVDAGNNDEFKASLLPDQVSPFDYAYRYSTTNGREWLYADLDGIGNGYSPSQAGKLTVVASSDTTPPATPTGLTVVTASPAGITLRWNAVTGDPTLYGYEVRRSTGAMLRRAATETNPGAIHRYGGGGSVHRLRPCYLRLAHLQDRAVQGSAVEQTYPCEGRGAGVSYQTFALSTFVRSSAPTPKIRRTPRS